jgi:isoquinoline 1-oxidoreductase subunit alpha
MCVPFRFTVNGKPASVDVDPDTPLLWLLRDHLQLTGTKYGCGIGVCGACTVHEGKTAVRACQITAEQANGKSFTTIEGLNSPLAAACRKAWLDEDVAQCGYCQPAMIMEAAVLLRTSAAPTDGQIDEALGDHVCRCGTYPRIRKAIAAAAAALRKS